MMIRLVLALTVTVAVGLASRLCPAGWFVWDRVLGEVLYGVAAYLVWAMILYRRPVGLMAMTAFGCCAAVEAFKLTGVPADYQRVFLVRWFLGMTFDPVNLVYYFAGVGVVAVVDHIARKSTGRDPNVPDREIVPDVRADPGAARSQSPSSSADR